MLLFESKPTNNKPSSHDDIINNMDKLVKSTKKSKAGTTLVDTVNSTLAYMVVDNMVLDNMSWHNIQQYVYFGRTFYLLYLLVCVEIMCIQFNSSLIKTLDLILKKILKINVVFILNEMNFYLLVIKLFLFLSYC